MNIFVIPSWYPSNNQPLTGIFFKDQIQIFAHLHQDINFGISTWGQNDDRLLLWLRQPFKNLYKISKRKKIRPSQNELSSNFIEYFTPAFTWSRKIHNGNISGILQANIQNYRKFKDQYGEVQLILTHVGYPAGYIAFLLSRRLKVPYLIVEHMSPFPFPTFLNHKGEWIKELYSAYNDASAIISVSRSLSSKFKSKGYSNVHVIPNFIDDIYFHPTNNDHKVIKPIALTVGRLEHQKGIDVLLQSISQVNTDLAFKIGGDGTQIGSYQKLSEELSIEEQIVWLGSLNKSEVLQALHRCNFFILPSRHESFGIVILEALACGKPCIVTECEGPEEIINDEVGIVVEKENPQALAEAIDYMANNLDKYPAEKIRGYFDEHFSAWKTTNLLRQVFEEAIQSYKPH